MTLFEKQVQFGIKISALIQWINSLTFNGLPVAATLADGNIDSIRKVRLSSKTIQAKFAKFDIKIIGNLPASMILGDARDLTHLETGCHYKRLAQDLNLFVAGKWITMNTAEEAKFFLPLYKDIGDFWLRSHVLARWGGNFAKKDFNHFSFEHEGNA